MSRGWDFGCGVWGSCEDVSVLEGGFWAVVGLAGGLVCGVWFWVCGNGVLCCGRLEFLCLVFRLCLRWTVRDLLGRACW